MKRLFTILLALAAILPASADRYLTFTSNDTLRVTPTCLGNIQTVTMRAHFDGRLDKWDMTMILPQGMSLTSVNLGDDMRYIPYTNHLGMPDTCSAQLFSVEDHLNHKDSLSASIIVPGYWPDDHGGYDYYGTVKWEAGDYNDMCKLNFTYDINFPDTASMYIKEHLSSTFDQRGFTIPDTYLSYKRIFIYVGYLFGDVNGDDSVNIADYTDLIDYVIHHIQLDRYRLKAADMDGDGVLTITDVTMFGDFLIDHGIMSLDDPML